ncbi:MAG: glutathione S-transferase [Betaproteobacteria bacterium RBG_16_66_20]|nr:MAG: glutathione S-transferase [Betaproteobacteria bacterium RBG_16_66_20]
MQLYYHPASTTSRIVQHFATDQGIDLDYKVVDLFTGEHLKPDFAKINPNCLVPVLEDGDFRLTECSAILKYLADKAGSPAYPKDLKARARVNEMMDWFNSNIYKDFAYGLIYPQTFPHHKRPSDAVQAGTLEWAKQKTQGWLKILDASLIGPNKAYLCGDKITLADYMGAEMIALGGLLRCSYAAYPNIERWLGNMKALKGWPKVHEVIDGFAASLKDKSFVAV